MPRPSISKHTATTIPATAAQVSQKEYVTTKEAAVIIGLAKPTLDAMRAAGLGPVYVRVSPRRVVYPTDGLRAYMAAHTVNPLVS